MRARGPDPDTPEDPRRARDAVPGVNRVRHRRRHSQTSETPLLGRNFWFTMLDDRSTICTRERIGIENILFESDHPHADGTWPDTQELIEKVLGDLPVDEIRKITHENAAALYRHPLPDVCLS